MNGAPSLFESLEMERERKKCSVGTAFNAYQMNADQTESRSGLKASIVQKICILYISYPEEIISRLFYLQSLEDSSTRILQWCGNEDRLIGLWSVGVSLQALSVRNAPDCRPRTVLGF